MHHPAVLFPALPDGKSVPLAEFKSAEPTTTTTATSTITTTTCKKLSQTNELLMSSAYLFAVNKLKFGKFDKTRSDHLLHLLKHGHFLVFSAPTQKEALARYSLCQTTTPL